MRSTQKPKFHLLNNICFQKAMNEVFEET